MSRPHDEETPLFPKLERRASFDVAQDELSKMWKLALPMITTYLLEMLPGPVGIVLVGHISSPHTEEYIAAAATSIMFVNMVAVSTGFGLASAMDTLCSQAHGANEPKKMGTYLQTGTIVLSVLSLVVMYVMYRATDVLLLLGQPQGVSEMAGTFTRYMLPGLPFQYLFELLKKVLQAQNITLPQLYVAVVANVLHVGAGYYLVHCTAWGYLGVAIARALCNISLGLLICAYLLVSGRITSFWDGFQPTRALEGIGTFMNLGVSGMLQLCFEWWAFEVLGIICGLLPDAVLSIGANAVMMQISAMVYMFYYGISVSGSVRIGNALGAGQKDRADIGAKITLGMSTLCAAIVAGFLLGFAKRLPRLFTHDQSIVTLTTKLLYVAAAFQLGDAANAGVQGALRGSGRQVLGAKLNFIGYYVLGIPMGTYIAFGLGYGVIGLWMGMTISLYTIAILGSVLLFKSDWSSLVKEARSRLNE